MTLSREQRYIDCIWHDAEARMRERAEAEIAACDPRFVDWLCEATTFRSSPR